MDPKLKQFGRRVLSGLLMVAVFVWLAQRNSDEGRVITRDLLGLGTLITLTVYLEPTASAQELESLLDSIAAEIRDYEQTWSVLGDGALATLNRRLVRGERIEFPPELQPLLARAAELSVLSGGRFDPRVGRLVKVWQFDDQTDYRRVPPEAEELRAAVDALMRAPALTAEPAFGPAPGVQLDLGGIAKGEVAALIAQRLIDAGFDNLIVNLGGNVEVSGTRGERPWRIGIRHPRPREGTQQMLALLPTEGREAVVTSGDYERQFTFEGSGYHHILDPRTGQPARGVQSVTVVDSDAVLADAASTALFVAGAGWREVARAIGVGGVLVVLDDGTVQATPSLADRLIMPDDVALERVP